MQVLRRLGIGAVGMVAVLFWICWAVLVQTVPPASQLAYIVFFVFLFIALAATFASLAYGVTYALVSSRLYRGNLGHALRQGALLAGFVVCNALLKAGDAWNLWTALIIFVMLVLVEIVALAQK